jgi:hypothetical protein
MKKEWVLSVRDQCIDAGVPFFFKQWGGIRKKVAGRHLDGETYDAIPFGAEELEVPSRRERAQRVSRAQDLMAAAP